MTSGADRLAVGEVGAAGVAVEQHVEVVGGTIADRAHDVGVHHVVDQRDVLVADALDVVLAEPVLEHRRALEGLDGDDPRAVLVLQQVAGGDRAGRPGGRHERSQPQITTRRRAHHVEHVGHGAPGDGVVAEVVAELAELVEHEVLGILGEQVARVVDLLDVRLRAVGADHVVDRVLAPLLEPVEPFLAHPFREDRHAAARHDAADRDAATRVVARRRPDRTMAGGVELPRHDPRCQAGVRGEHLVGRDHREAVAEDDDDRAVDTGQVATQHHVVGHGDPAAGEVVVPVHPPQVAGVGALRVGVADETAMVERRRVGELGERRQRDPSLAEPFQRAFQRVAVDHPVGQSELVLERLRMRVGQRHELTFCQSRCATPPKRHSDVSVRSRVAAGCSGRHWRRARRTSRSPSATGRGPW